MKIGLYIYIRKLSIRSRTTTWISRTISNAYIKEKISSATRIREERESPMHFENTQQNFNAIIFVLLFFFSVCVHAWDSSQLPTQGKFSIFDYSQGHHPPSQGLKQLKLINNGGWCVLAQRKNIDYMSQQGGHSVWKIKSLNIKTNVLYGYESYCFEVRIQEDVPKVSIFI